MKQVSIPEELKRLHPFWNAWHIEGVLGSGAYGKVFRIVKHDRSGIYEAALKWIPLPENEQEMDLRRSEGLLRTDIDRYYSDRANELEQEIKLLSRFKGTSHIVSYEDHLIEKRKKSIGWDILIRMELLSPLNEYLSHNLVTCHDIVTMGIDLCDALSLCHRNKVLHRDIKPANIFRSGNGDFKLGDFGISRRVESKSDKLTQIGTWDYMAPEVKMGSSYGVAADIYSLGLVMYKVLNESFTPKCLAASGHLTGEQNDQAVFRLLQGEALPKPMYGTDALWAILQKACALLPQDRYEDADCMRADLDKIKNDPELNQVITSGQRIPAAQHQMNSLTGTGTILIPGSGGSPSRKKRTESRMEGHNTKQIYYIAAGGCLIGLAAIALLLAPKLGLFGQAATPAPVVASASIPTFEPVPSTPVPAPTTPAPTTPAPTTPVPTTPAPTTPTPTTPAPTTPVPTTPAPTTPAPTTPVPTTPAPTTPVPTTPAPTTPAPTTPAPTAPVPTTSAPITPEPTLKPTPAIAMTIQKGDTLTIVNCESFVSLRNRPDGNYTSGRKSISLYDTVTFVQTAGNGFYLVDYKGKTGYILAPYLAPGAFGDPVSEAAYDRAFNQNDLTVNGIELGRSQRLDVINQYGNPVITEETNKSIVLKYSDFSVTFNNSGHTASRVDIYNFNAHGPRNICVGMNLAEALNTFPMNNSRILNGSITHDLILYSNINEVLDPPYAVIRNDGEGGNGVIEFYDPIKKAHMEITILNCRVIKFSVYMEQ